MPFRIFIEQEDCLNQPGGTDQGCLVRHPFALSGHPPSVTFIAFDGVSEGKAKAVLDWLGLAGNKLGKRSHGLDGRLSLDSQSTDLKTLRTCFSNCSRNPVQDSEVYCVYQREEYFFTVSPLTYWPDRNVLKKESASQALVLNNWPIVTQF